MQRTRNPQPRESGPVPIPHSQLDEIVEFYQRRAVEGEPIEQIRAQTKFFRPEVRTLLDRKLDRLVKARIKR